MFESINNKPIINIIPLGFTGLFLAMIGYILFYIWQI
jgi:hypothetical protein